MMGKYMFYGMDADGVPPGIAPDKQRCFPADPSYIKYTSYRASLDVADLPVAPDLGAQGGDLRAPRFPVAPRLLQDGLGEEPTPLRIDD